MITRRRSTYRAREAVQTNRATSLDDAITRINDSDYGLGATIWTADPERGLGVARRIESGTVWINKHLDLPFDLPYEGSKQSGMGKDGLEDYTQAKTINIAR